MKQIVLVEFDLITPADAKLAERAALNASARIASELALAHGVRAALAPLGFVPPVELGAGMTCQIAYSAGGGQ